MKQEWILIFLIALSLFTMQAVGGYFQIKDYKKAIRRVHRLGNVGIGQKKGGFFSGYLVLIACDANGIITAVEVMEGLTFLTKFQARESVMDFRLVGSHIMEFLAYARQQDKKKYKKLKGYIQAAEALELRLYPEKEEENCMQPAEG